jgi:hypothetical protein
MVPMAIPSFGGMLIVVITMYVVPVTYGAVRERRLRTALRREAQPAPPTSVLEPGFLSADFLVAARAGGYASAGQGGSAWAYSTGRP